MKIVIIGSGPSAVAAASALVESSHEIEMLDFGNEMEDEARKLMHRLRSQNRAESDLLALRKGLKVGTSSHESELKLLFKLLFSPNSSANLNKKKLFGSEFVFRDADEYLRLTKHYSSIPLSLAKGGLSNVWGAACYPFIKEDFVDWPIDVNEMEESYKKVNDLLHIEETVDPLSEVLPVYRSKEAVLSLNSQAANLLETWKQSQEQLQHNGFAFGRSRLAVLAQDRDGRQGCQYCGLCLYGCPYGSIYNSAFTVEQLQRHKNFCYRPGFFARTFKESPDGKVTVEVEEVCSKSRVTFQCDKLFLGAGTLSTLRIVADSLKEYSAGIPILDNDMFIMPLLKLSRWNTFDPKVKFTLSQLALLLKKPEICDELIHMQLYSYSDYVFDQFSFIIHRLPRLIQKKVLDILYNTFIMFGYFHSNHSRTITARIIPSKGGGVASLEMKSLVNPKRKVMLKRWIKELKKHRRALDLYPMKMGLRITQPGFSGHLAGSIPMRKLPSMWHETDRSGRLFGTQSVYIVDQSSFPSLPAQNVTYTAMANAHRVAKDFLRGCQ